MTKRIAQVSVVLLTLVFLLIPSAIAGSGTVTIFGTNQSNAQQNVSIQDVRANVNVSAWSSVTNIAKTFKVGTQLNATDTFYFNLGNMTAGVVYELRVNNSAVNAYQANSSGWIAFNRSQGQSNQSYTIQPAINAGGYNWTFGYFQNLIVQTMTTLYNVTIYNATRIQGDGSYITILNASNLTVGTIPSARYGNVSLINNTLSNADIRHPVANITANYTAGISGNDTFLVSAYAGELNFTIPSPVGMDGKTFDIKKTDNTVNKVSVFSPERIDGALWANISTQYASITLIAGDGTWNII